MCYGWAHFVRDIQPRFLISLTGLLALLGTSAKPLRSQRPDSSTAPPLAWTEYYPEQMWGQLTRGLRTIGDTGTVVITVPRVRGRSIVLYGRMGMGNTRQQSVGWVRRVGNDILLYLTRLYVGDIGSPTMSLDVFKAVIGPLPHGSYVVHVMWEGEPRPGQVYEGTIGVP